MTGKTSLFQRAGSPLIQGRSRHARPFWTDWLAAGSCAVLGVYGVLGLGTLIDPTRPYLTSPLAWLMWLGLPWAGLLVLMPVSGAGAWLGRVMGWRRAWVFGAVLGTVSAIVAMALSWRIL